MTAELFRKLTFRSHDLGADTTLVLTFNDDRIPGIYERVYPTAFRVTHFGKTGGYTHGVVYKDLFGFTRISNHTVRPASTYSNPIKLGQETSLTKEDKFYRFSEPKEIKPQSKQIVARNETKGKEDIGVAFFIDPKKPPSTILFFEDVGSGSHVHIQFTPLLRGYITKDYQEGDIIRGQVNSPVLFSLDLSQLEEETMWRITYNAGDGKYEITQESEVFAASQEIGVGCSTTEPF